MIRSTPLFAAALGLAALALAGCSGASPSGSPSPGSALPSVEATVPAWDGTGCPGDVLANVPGSAEASTTDVVPSAVADLVGGACIIRVSTAGSAETHVYVVQPSIPGDGDAFQAAIEGAGWVAAGPGWSSPDEKFGIEFGAAADGAAVAENWPELGDAFASYPEGLFVVRVDEF